MKTKRKKGVFFENMSFFRFISYFFSFIPHYSHFFQYQTKITPLHHTYFSLCNTFHYHSTLFSLLSLFGARICAIIVPDIECHAQLTAHGMTASGHETMKNSEARTVARPAFCIPTSMEMVRFLAAEK